MRLVGPKGTARNLREGGGEIRETGNRKQETGNGKKEEGGEEMKEGWDGAVGWSDSRDADGEAECRTHERHDAVKCWKSD